MDGVGHIPGLRNAGKDSDTQNNNQYKEKTKQGFYQKFFNPPYSIHSWLSRCSTARGLILGYSRDVPPSLRLVSLVFALVDKRVILVSYVKYGTQSIHL